LAEENFVEAIHLQEEPMCPGRKEDYVFTKCGAVSEESLRMPVYHLRTS